MFKALIVYAHLLVDGVRKTRFLADVKLGECDAVSIEGANSNHSLPIHLVLEDYGLNYSFGFGSDEASVIMTGHENGVAALIKRKNSYFISVHCAAHRLTLVSSQAADIPCKVCSVKRTLPQISTSFIKLMLHLLIYLKSKFCLLHNQAVSALRKAKFEFFKNLSSNLHSPKKQWVSHLLSDGFITAESATSKAIESPKFSFHFP